MNSVSEPIDRFLRWFEGGSAQSRPWIAAREDVVFPAAGLDPLWIWMSTSGSTGTPRWVGHTRETMLASARGVCQWLEVSAKDTWACILPLHHMGGLSIPVRAIHSGCRLAHWERPWDPAQVAEWLDVVGASLVSVVPTQVWDWVNAGIRAPRGLRAVIVGADRLPPALATRARELGWPVLASYGSTETASMIACDHTQWIACDHTQWIACDPGQGISPGLCLLPHARVAPIGDEERFTIEAASLFRAELAWTEQGADSAWTLRYRAPGPWLSPDRARIAESLEGLQWIEVLGRGEDYVKILGEGVNLASLDQRLAALLPSGRSAAFFAEEDPRSGKRIALAIEEDERAPWIDELVARWDGSVLGVERIHRVALIGKFPRTELGKLRRSALAQLAV